MRRGAETLRAAVIALAGLASYVPALRGGFVFDDVPLVQHGALVHGPLWRIWLGTSSPDYWPLTMTSFWAEWRLWGEAAWGYHAINVALHACAALLLWRVLRRLRIPGAWLAGLLFAAHPVAVESVAWISERKNTLSAVLFLCTTLAWIRFEETRRARLLVLAAALFGLALLAKTSVAPLPIVLLAISAHRRGRIERSAIAAAAPLFALSLAAGAATIWFQHRNAMARLVLPPRGALERLGGAAWALGSYLQKAFVPAGLAFTYPDWPVDPGSPLFFLPLVLVVALGAVLWRGRAAWGRAPLLALGYHALMVLPILGFVDIAFFAIAPVSNHLQYLALIGPAALVGAALSAVAARWRVPGIAATAALLATFGAITAVRASAFRDELTLWQEAVRAAPDSAFAHHQLAVSLAEHGRGADALEELAAMARVTRDPADRHHARALWLLASERAAEAAREADAAVRERPSPEFSRTLGIALVKAGRGADAVEVLEPIVRTSPEDADHRYWLGAALANAGRVRDAIEVLEEGCRLAPDDPRLQDALATLRSRGRAAPPPAEGPR